MKLRKLFLRCACIAVATASIMLAIRFTTTATEWPSFVPNETQKPQYDVQLARDYGFRTGNLVPVKIYFKVPEGTTLELESLSVHGDLQIVDRDFHEEKGEHGLKYVRATLKLQGFIYKTKWVFEPSIDYNVAGDPKRQLLKMAPVEVSTSRTYDERKSNHPLDPELKENQGHHMVWTVLTVGGGGIGFLICLIGLFLVKRSTGQKTEVVEETVETPDDWANITKAAASIEAGDRTKKALLALVLALRERFDVELATIEELAAQPAHEALAAVLAVCEDAIWGARDLAPEEASNLLQDVAKLRPQAAESQTS